MIETPEYRGYRFPPEIIGRAEWLYHRFTQSFRDVEDLFVGTTGSDVIDLDVSTKHGICRGLSMENAMVHIAKLFMNGHSQVVRLPAEFRFDETEVYIRRDPVSGDVVISRRPGGWDEFFELTNRLDVPQDFMTDRHDGLPQERPESK